MSAPASQVWLEFSVTVPDSRTEKGLPLCGLCGNSGNIRTTWKHKGTLHRVTAFCICPNGRAIRTGINGSTKWGGTSIRSRVVGRKDE